MPRKPRFIIPGVPVHIVQRGHSRNDVFFDEPDYLAYLKFLKEASERYQCAIHAYVLMTNHIHLLAVPQDNDGITRMMQYIGRHYVPYIHNAYGGSGSLWEGRYKASLIQDDRYLLTCMRYIELNPVRAKMVNTPTQYRWSSYHRNGRGKPDEILTAHPLYQSLGKTEKGRQTAYKALFREVIDTESLTDIRNAWQTGTPLGNERFLKQVEKRLKCRVGQARRGRPGVAMNAGKGL